MADKSAIPIKYPGTAQAADLYGILNDLGWLRRAFDSLKRVMGDRGKDDNLLLVKFKRMGSSSIC